MKVEKCSKDIFSLIFYHVFCKGKDFFFNYKCHSASILVQNIAKTVRKSKLSVKKYLMWLDVLIDVNNFWFPVKACLKLLQKF